MFLSPTTSPNSTFVVSTVLAMNAFPVGRFLLGFTLILTKFLEWYSSFLLDIQWRNKVRYSAGHQPYG
jgi:hypothetical protein